MKQCCKCKLWLDELNYNKDKGKSDGLSTQCKFCANKNSKKYYQEHKEQKLKYQHKYREQNTEEINRKKKEHYYRNQDRINTERREKYLKYKDNAKYKLNRAISKAVYEALKGAKSEQHWEDLVNYSIQDLKEHLESQFTSEMSWDNFGNYWEIDHIVPRNLFNFNSSEDHDFKICWSLMNLRPLYWLDNRRRPKDGRDISKDIKNKILKQNIT